MPQVSALKSLSKSFLLASAALICSCASLPEPSKTVDTLVVGQIVFEAANFETMQGGSLSINGVNTDGLTVAVTNYQSKKTTKIPATGDGYFSSAVLPAGNYFIADILLDKTIISSGGVSGEFKIAVNPSSTTKFVLAPGAVTNLGKIVWTADAKKGSDVAPREDFSTVKSQFETKHLKSAWNTLPWNSVKVTQHLDFDVDLSAVAIAPVSATGSPAEFKNASFDPTVRKVPQAVLALQKSDPDAFLKGLVEFLAKDSPNAFVTVKRLHDWVADNISYDAPSFLAGRLPDQGYRAVLVSKLAVCEGYATLFKKLCDLAGVPCALVDGYSRGYGSSVFAKEDPTKSNHAWNLVQINKGSYLVDTTWDAGFLENGRFKKSYSTGYLFAQPASFVRSHFPQNPQYQLLASPLDAAGFTKLAGWNSYFFTAGITNVTKLDKINRLGNDFVLVFQVPAGVDLIAVLEDAANQKEIEGATFRQQSGSNISINVALPKPGSYILRLFEHESRDAGEEYPGCGEVGFIADKESHSRFPKMFSSFVKNDLLLAPLGTPIVSGQSVTFQAQLPRVPFAYIVIGKASFPMVRDAKSDTFTAKVLIPDGAKSAVLAQSQLQNGGWEGLLEFPVVKP